MTGINLKRYPGIFYFCILFWIGFFVKFAVHSIIKYPFAEPVGQFKGINEQWRDFFILSSLGCMPIILFNVFLQFKRRTKLNIPIKSYFASLSLLPKKDFFAFLSMLTAITVLIQLVNFRTGIYVVGLTAKTIFPWPLNSVISWFLYIGSVLTFCELYRYCLLRQSKRILVFTILVFTSLVTSISILSRGTIVYQIFPIVVAFLIYRKELQISYSELLFKFTLFLAAVGITISIVGGLRNVAFADWQDSENNDNSTLWSDNYFKNSNPKNLPMKDTVILFLRLAVDRWIGAEGLMAVIGYPGRSENLFWSKKVWKNDDLTGNLINEVSNSIYKMDPKKPYRFTTLPGPLAFLYYSNCIFYLIAGCALIYLIIFSLDFLAFTLRKNIFTSHVVGFWVANSFAQFGVNPFALLKGLVFTFGFLLFCYLFKIALRQRLPE